MGEPHKTEPVRGATESLPVRIQHRQDLATVEQELDHAVLAVVLVPPLRGALPEHGVSALRANAEGEGLPIFLVLPEDASPAQTARLYRRGATAVLAWPGEASLLRGLVAEHLEFPFSRSGASEADVALRRAIQLRLRLLGKETKGLRVSVRGGSVAITGTTDRLWKKLSLEDHLAQVPGVTAVSVRGLVVGSSGLADREVERTVRNLLKGASSIQDGTLAISVHKGHVVLIGTVLNREEWEHLLQLLSMAEGVRSVSNKTVLSTTRKKRLRGQARRLQSLLDELLNVKGAGGIGVAVIGDVAVLRGRARFLATKREAERIVSSDEAISRVVNKIEVAAPEVSR